MDLNDYSLEGLHRALEPQGPSEASTRKLFAAIFAHRVESMEQLLALPQLPRAVRLRLEDEGRLPRLEVVERRRADDGFVKYLFSSPLGGRFEAVRIPIFDTHYVVCLSSQVGCALACDFCMTGKLGFQRNLQTWEMVEQVQVIRAEADRPVRGAVFMGMGEALLNYDHALRAADILRNPAGLAIGSRRITVSTAGHVAGIRRYVRERQPYRMAFSVTSALPEKRVQVMPIEKTWPLPDLVDAIGEYARVRRERAMIAYVVIKGFNTGREDALALRDAFAGIPITLDLIDVTDPTGRYEPPDAEELSAFRDELQVLGAPVARRYSGGKDIGAACGTLEGARRGGVVLAPRQHPDA